MVFFHKSLRDSRYTQVSKALLSILSDLRNAVVRKVSTCPLISRSFSPFINHLLIVPIAPITRGCPRGVMVKAMDCRIIVSEFVL